MGTPFSRGPPGRALSMHQAAKGQIARDVQDRIERVRTDERFAAKFEAECKKIHEERLLASTQRYGPIDHVEKNTAAVWDLHSPRASEERVQRRADLQRERMAAAKERLREMEEAEEKLLPNAL